jgi:hypothetical protein
MLGGSRALAGAGAQRCAPTRPRRRVCPPPPCARAPCAHQEPLAFRPARSPAGAYTTVRTVGGDSVFELTFHIDRLASTAKLMMDADSQVGSLHQRAAAGSGLPALRALTYPPARCPSLACRDACPPPPPPVLPHPPAAVGGQAPRAGTGGGARVAV